MVIPKGRLFKNVVNLLNDAGLGIEVNDRQYVPRVEDPEVEAKIMKPQNIAQLVEVGSHDIGFTGYDWITETSADVKTVMDLQFDPVEVVAAVPYGFNRKNLFNKRIVVASEYENITLNYLHEKKYNFYFIRTFGATEVFPPDDADMIIDNISTGRTLEENHLKIMDRIMTSSTRFIVNRKAFKDPWKRKKIDQWVTLFQGVLDARERVMLEMNVPTDKLNAIVRECPCMRAPTVSPLYNDEGFAVKIAIRRWESIKLIPKLKAMGASDILEYEFRKVVI
jgi:ATP phosphoribosyltransferase